MKKLAVLLFCLTTNFAFGQQVSVPANMSFAGVSIGLDESARSLVQADANALVSNRNALNNRMERAFQYFPIIETIFAEENIPEDFKYLVLQESGLVSDAVSSSNAVGFWQMKLETAKDVGLRVDDAIDERKNIHAATRGAARYFKRNNGVLNNWVSTMYSYYLGLGGMRKLVPVFWTGATEISLNANTDRYILRCLAHKLVFSKELPSYQNAGMVLFEYRLSPGKTFTEIADELSVDEVELRKNNRWVGGSKVPTDREYVMVMPIRDVQLESFRQKNIKNSEQQSSESVAKNELGFPLLRRTSPGKSINENTPVFYDINGKPGVLAKERDTYATLAEQGRTSKKKFLARNDREDTDGIVPGMVYYLKKKDKKAVLPFHTTQTGQSLWEISQIYGIQLACLMKYNRIENPNEPPQRGRVLWMQKTRPKNQPIEFVKLPDEQPAEIRRWPGTEPKKTEPKPEPSVIRVVPPTEEGVRVLPQNGTPQGSGRVVMVEDSRESTYTPQKTPDTRPSDRPVYTPDTRPVDRPTYSPPPTDTRPTYTPSTESTTQSSYHTVKQGETFFSIARQYNVTPTTLRQWNNLNENPAVRVGQRFLIQGSTQSAGVESSNEDAISTEPMRVVVEGNNGLESIIHTVAQGETFASVARLYGLTLQQLRDLNGFSSIPTVRRGQQLNVIKRRSQEVSQPTSTQPTYTPPTTSAPVTSGRSGYHTVRTGETFYSIARKYDISPQQLRDFNSLTEFPAVRVGERLLVPGVGEAQPTSNGATQYHTVRKGDTLFSLSKQYGTSVDELRRLNNISATGLQLGTKIKIKE